MGKLSEFLSGKKTYIVAIAVAIVTALYQAQQLDEHSYSAIVGALGALGLWTMRAAVAKSGPASE